jgi:hypothetical protein
LLSREINFFIALPAHGQGGFFSQKNPLASQKLRQRRAFGIPIFVAAKILSWLGFATLRKTANAVPSPVAAFAMARKHRQAHGSLQEDKINK